MGVYISIEDAKRRLKDSFLRLYAMPDDAQDLQTDIGSAEAQVNGYAGKRYKVPITAPPPVLAFLREQALCLWAEIAWRRGASDEIPTKVKEAADNARKVLKDISAGLVTLGGVTGLTEQNPGGTEAIVEEAAPSRFKSEQMGPWGGRQEEAAPPWPPSEGAPTPP